MPTTTELLWRHIRNERGPFELDHMPRLEELEESEWCPEFEELMRARLIMGAFRYGLFKDTQNAEVNRIASIRKRLELFESDNNLEHLVDVANLALCVFQYCRRLGYEITPVDDGEHAERE